MSWYLSGSIVMPDRADWVNSPSVPVSQLCRQQSSNM